MTELSYGYLIVILHVYLHISYQFSRITIIQPKFRTTKLHFLPLGNLFNILV